MIKEPEMNIVYVVITNGGDGSNGLQWALDEAVIDRLKELVENGHEGYSSGDGLQYRKIGFHDEFNIEVWLNANHLNLVTLKDLESWS